MRLTKKLLSFLPRVFNKSPGSELALRLSYDGQMTWRVEDGVLITSVVGGSGQGLSVQLRNYTIDSLASFLASRSGYSIPFMTGSDVRFMSAMVLMDGSGSISESNGDHLYAYTSVLWAYLEAMSAELQEAGVQVREMLDQMSIKTSDGLWLDEIGGYYGIPRQIGEDDATYGPRIVTEVLRPRSNNVAIEAAIRELTGQPAVVRDVVVYQGATPAHNSLITHNSAYTHNATARPIYGLFDVEVGFDLLGSQSPDDFVDRVSVIVSGLRASGTHMRSVALSASDMGDSFTQPSEAFGSIAISPSLTDTADEPTEDWSSAIALSALSDSLTAPSEDAEMTVTRDYQHNSARLYNSAIVHAAGDTPEVLP